MGVVREGPGTWCGRWRPKFHPGSRSPGHAPHWACRVLSAFGQAGPLWRRAPCVVTPGATILAGARDHINGGSVEPTAARAFTLVQGLHQNAGMQDAQCQDIHPGTDDILRPVQEV